VPAAAQSGVVAIAAGNEHNLALKADGTIVAWGNNDSWQTKAPASLTEMSAIAAGGYHSLALGTVSGGGDPRHVGTRLGDDQGENKASQSIDGSRSSMSSPGYRPVAWADRCASHAIGSGMHPCTLRALSQAPQE
jgi:hypothetical protein